MIIILTMIIFLSHEVLPIAMGARPEDYERQAPFKSYIHVDQFAGPIMIMLMVASDYDDDDVYDDKGR